MKSLFDTFTFAIHSDLIEDAHIYQQSILDLILAAVLNPSFLSSKNKPRLNNKDLVRLARHRLSDDLLIRVIAVYDNDFELSSNSLLKFRKSGLGEKVIEALLCKMSAAPVFGAVQDLGRLTSFDEMIGFHHGFRLSR
jgi:hypothetical protein